MNLARVIYRFLSALFYVLCILVSLLVTIFQYAGLIVYMYIIYNLYTISNVYKNAHLSVSNTTWWN
jgi:hypothetical protein